MTSCGLNRVNIVDVATDVVEGTVASGPYRSHHILSSRYPGSWCVRTPFIALNLCFALAQYDSIACVWTPVMAALDISTGPLARRTFQTAGPVRASTFHLSLARTGHLDICRASRFQIVLARTMTNHSMYFSRGSPPHISAVFAQSFCYSETPAWREESGMSIKHTDVSV